MKKSILLTAAALMIGAGAFAQDVNQPVQNVDGKSEILKQSHLSSPKNAKGFGQNKSAGVTDTFTLANDSMLAGQTQVIYYETATPLDSGLLYGTNARELKGFAELYDGDFDASNNNDTTVQVLGFYSKWGGKIQTASTKQVTFSVWKTSTTKTLVSGKTKFYVYGTPGALYTNGSRTFNANTINTSGSSNFHYLTTPVTGIASDFYVGYTIAYTWAAVGTDTFGLRNTVSRDANYYTLESGTNDTLLHPNIVVQDKTGTWKSVYYDLNVGNGDPIIAPMVQVSCPKCGATGVAGGFKSGNVTFYGNYPNPVATTTNLKFSLKKNTGVKVTVYDAVGRQIKALDLGTRNAGDQQVSISAEELSSGNYPYLIETTDGDVIASQMTVVK